MLLPFLTLPSNWVKTDAQLRATLHALLHGDSHLGNFFVSGNEMGMLDWQATH